MGSSSQKQEAQVEVEVVFAVPQALADRSDLMVRHPKMAPIPLDPAKKNK